MKRIPTLFLALLCVYVVSAQPSIREKKYPSLLWEITGKGMKKPSYLIGTMHVSSKLAFNLPDSFYIAIRNAQVVALETNPETWQDDMDKYDFEDRGVGYPEFSYRGMSVPSDYLSINTLKFYKYETKIERSLYSNPSTINNLLYRNYGNESSDFEEDTYLDMYIYQCGKKWGKKVAGVEDYGESMKLMKEAYEDAAKDKSRKDRSWDDDNDEYSIEKLQDAYRSGNLDLLDSINRYHSFSKAFDEKFLYRRNEIQAHHIDSIMRSGSVLFVGVGAAHLPGKRGVIEILREKGYKLRPIKMGERASRDKDVIDKMRVPVVFRTESAEDGLYTVDIPGKFYKTSDESSLDQRQFADMANGSYYMVTRIMTNAWMWGHTADNVYRTIDSLIYENVPGKIVSKTNITRNGYRGFDIVNRTRRGDMQRYNIFITPFEILFFKMSGNGDYISNGDEAKRFFGSIKLKEYSNGSEQTNWKKWSPAYGGFAIDLPHEPYIGNDGSWIFDATDRKSGNHYRVIRSDIHNYRFAEEDTFDLSLMEESFMSSEFIDTQLSRRQVHYKGYPALDATFKDKQGKLYFTRFLIQGPHYYTLVAHAKEESNTTRNFLNSFEIVPFIYGEARNQKDTSLYYNVKTPVFPDDKKIKFQIPGYSLYYRTDDDDEESEDDKLEGGTFRNKIISNDTTGEKIYVSFYRSARYYYLSDTAELDRDYERSAVGDDTTWIIRSKKKYVLPNKFRVWEGTVSDSGSSRMLWCKSYYKDGIGFSIATQMDTLTAPSSFVKTFFETFMPVDTLKGVDPFSKKSNLFFSDYLSTDSVLHKRAVKQIRNIDLDSTDLPKLKQVIEATNWKEKKYIDTKIELIGKLADMNTRAASLYLKDLYYAAGDTVKLQYVALESLLNHQTAYAYSLFREIMVNEPPVLDAGGYYTSYSSRLRWGSYDHSNFLDELGDTLQLTRTILPDLLPLLNLDDYEQTIIDLLGTMIDSNLVKPKDYEAYFSKFLIEAKQKLRKQSIAEKKKAIEKAEDDKEDKTSSSYDDDDDGKDSGNSELTLLTKLLIPYWDLNAQVQPYIQQLLRSNDKRLKYNTLLELMKQGKPYPDTLLNYFGGLDDYRFELYQDLKDIKKFDKFPKRFNNHLDLGRSALIDRKTYGKPDSIVYLDRLAAEFKGKKGFLYFYKVKDKKDDLTWKIAVVGLVPEDPAQFEFTDEKKIDYRFNYAMWPSYKFNRYDFTEFTDTKLKVDESLQSQLKKALKRALYSKRPSAKEFYEDDNERRTTPYYD